MVKYKPFYKHDADAFLRLYKKFLEYKYETINKAFNELPTDVIEYIFDGIDIQKKENELFITFGYKNIDNLAKELEYLYQKHLDGELVDFMKKFGHKINLKIIGVRNK